MSSSHAASADTDTAAIFASRHEDALELDLSILRLALSRNQTAHRRTRYHRHMTMALQCWDRHGIHQLPKEWTVFATTTWMQWKEAVKKHNLNIKKKRKRDEHLWEIQPKKHHQRIVEPDPSGPLQEAQQQFTSSLDSLLQRTLQGWEEVDSRMSYAVKSIVAEISRGFFLPFLTVALGAMARIRTLFLRFRLELTTRMVPDLLRQLPSKSRSTETTLYDPITTLLQGLCRAVEDQSRQKIENKEKKQLRFAANASRLGVSMMGGNSKPKHSSGSSAEEMNDSETLELQSTSLPDQIEEADTSGVDIGESLAGDNDAVASSRDDVEPDRHLELVASIQQSNKKKRKKEKKPKKRKAKKEKKEPDFFDNLFDR